MFFSLSFFISFVSRLLVSFCPLHYLPSPLPSPLFSKLLYFVSMFFYPLLNLPCSHVLFDVFHFLSFSPFHFLFRLHQNVLVFSLHFLFVLSCVFIPLPPTSVFLLPSHDLHVFFPFGFSSIYFIYLDYKRVITLESQFGDMVQYLFLLQPNEES